MKFTVRLLFAFMLLLPALGSGQAKPQGADLPVHSTPDFEVTGDGTDSAWSKADWTTLPQRLGNSGYPTKVKLLHSEKGIYCLFHCTDTKITSTLREDFSNLFKEDVVEIFFWPDESFPIYFEYELSPYGYELPILVPNLKGKINGWRPWHYEGERVTRRQSKIQKKDEIVSSWTAEVFIPYLLLRPLIIASPKKGDKWRVNMYRLDYDDGETRWSWKPTRKNFHDYESFGRMSFE